MIEQSKTASHVTVNEMVELLSNAYSSLIANNISVKKFPSVMLWGPPGVGKSQGVRQIAAELERMMGKTVNVTDVRLLLFNPVDLRGIPTSNADKTLAIWLKPQIFQMDDSNDVVNILFLDEISAAPPSVQAAAYQITLDRTVGEHRLPDNCIVIAAGNRVTDKSVAYNMPKALANRMCHFEVYSKAESWVDWAITAGVNDKVLSFIEYKPDMLLKFSTETEGNAFPTARTWEMVSNVLNYISEDIGMVYPLITGCVGEDAAKEFRRWDEVYTNVPPVKEIFAGKHKIIPKMPAILFALSSRIVTYARTHPSQKGINNAIEYVDDFPLEFKNKVFSGLRRINGIKPILNSNDIYREWLDASVRGWM